MKNSLLASLVFFASPLPAFAAVTLQGVISGLASGTPSPDYASVGAGTPVSFSFDLPDDPGIPSGIYPLAAALAGAPPLVRTGFGFQILNAPVTTGPDRVSMGGNWGVTGNPALVFIHSLEFVDPTGAALEGSSQVVGIPLVEAALQAGRFPTGTLRLIDQVITPGIGHEWSYTFTIVPEPASMLLAGTGVVLAWRRRRPPELRAGSVEVGPFSRITSPPREDSRRSL